MCVELNLMLRKICVLHNSVMGDRVLVISYISIMYVKLPVERHRFLQGFIFSNVVCHTSDICYVNYVLYFFYNF